MADEQGESRESGSGVSSAGDPVGEVSAGVIDLMPGDGAGSESGDGDDPMELLNGSGSDSASVDYSSSGDEEDRALNAQRRSHMLSTMTFDTSMPGRCSVLIGGACRG
jgi:hypothetical protein